MRKLLSCLALLAVVALHAPPPSEAYTLPEKAVVMPVPPAHVSLKADAEQEVIQAPASIMFIRNIDALSTTLIIKQAELRLHPDPGRSQGAASLNYSISGTSLNLLKFCGPFDVGWLS